MIETSARLLALLALLQLRREWTGAELAARLEVGPRTIRRDIDKLRRLGYPVEAAPGVAGGYRLGAGADLPPLLLDDQEAIAVAVGLRTAAAGQVAGIEETSVRALAKLEQLMPDRLRRRVSALSQSTSAFSLDGPRIDPDVLVGLAAACRDGMRVRFGYLSRSERATVRLVDPAAVVFSGHRWYLLAFDLDRDDWRTFRLDRITSQLRHDGRAVRRTPPGGDAAAFVQRQLRRHREGEEAPAGRIRLHAPVAEIRPRLPAGAVTVEADGEDTCIVTTVGPWSGRFLVWAALLDVELELLGPPGLLAAAARVHAGLAPRHGPAGPPADGGPLRW
ncbi:YafY family protein [Conexibacter sp. DBS9H8]|uniref:helix-turn-helix transcriptional regulator n=1 Tax=Conexibacter sp. DBS9H8 TaxID=2937801 RepID=UPI00200EF493|nr:WYL domain-containing protein [Conexibacter sp. DBS9H8]